MNHPLQKSSLLVCLILVGLLSSASILSAQNAPSPATAIPQTEPLSPEFHLTVQQAAIPVYLARVVSLPPDVRRSLAGSPLPKQTATASFASFDLTAPAQVSVTCNQAVQSARLLPTSAGITPTITGNTITFTVAKPGQFTLEVNGDWISSLHLFADPPETVIPNANDPNVIYYGPGIHQVENVKVASGKTVYLAPGAVIYGKNDPGSVPGPIFSLQGTGITLRGRGIIDGSRCPDRTRSIIEVRGSHIQVEGVILRDSSQWNLPIRQSDHIHVDNVKILGWRGNSDGLDICNSRQVDVRDCFLRTFDDLIVLKTDKGQGELRDVTVEHCVLSNEFAHALSLGAELREPLTHIAFSDCDIIHDKGREWLLRVFNTDSATVKNVVFDQIRIEEARRLMSVWIGASGWSKEGQRGHVDGVAFTNIHSPAPEVPGPFAELIGFDAQHAIDHVQFQNVVIGGHPLQQSDLNQNAFVHDVGITP